MQLDWPRTQRRLESHLDPLLWDTRLGRCHHCVRAAPVNGHGAHHSNESWSHSTHFSSPHGEPHSPPLVPCVVLWHWYGNGRASSPTDLLLAIPVIAMFALVLFLLRGIPSELVPIVRGLLSRDGPRLSVIGPSLANLSSATEIPVYPPISSSARGEPTEPKLYGQGGETVDRGTRCRPSPEVPEQRSGEPVDGADY